MNFYEESWTSGLKRMSNAGELELHVDERLLTAKYISQGATLKHSKCICYPRLFLFSSFDNFNAAKR